MTKPFCRVLTEETSAYTLMGVFPNRLMPGDKLWFIVVDGKEVFHREDGPAIECINGDYAYCFNGRQHRPENEGPAMRCHLSDNLVIEQYTFHGKLHRKNGPAVLVVKNNDPDYYTEIDCRNGKFHSDSQPALRTNRGVAWFSVNEHLSKSNWQEKTFMRHEAICNDVFH